MYFDLFKDKKMCKKFFHLSTIDHHMDLSNERNEKRVDVPMEHKMSLHIHKQKEKCVNDAASSL